jgi:hypothetical protein
MQMDNSKLVATRKLPATVARHGLICHSDAIPARSRADAQSVRVWRGGLTTISLRGPHSGTVTFWIVQRPEHGKLSDLRLLGDNRATITCQNAQDDARCSF